MLDEIIVISVFLILISLLLIFLLVPLLQVLINMFILYLLFLRIHAEITRAHRAEIYVYSAVLAFFVQLLIGNILPLWWITTYALLTFLLSFAVRHLLERRK